MGVGMEQRKYDPCRSLQGYDRTVYLAGSSITNKDPPYVTLHASYHFSAVCARMAPALRKSAPGLPQQWPKQDRIWWCNTISFEESSICTNLVTSILLYGCDTWTLLADSEEKNKTEQEKRSGHSTPSACGNFSVSPTWSTRPTPGCEAQSTSL